MSWFGEIETGLFITFSLLLLYVAYITLLKYWDKSRVIDQVIVQNLDDPYNISGVQYFQFELNSKRGVKLVILDVNETILDVLLDADLEEGKHTVEFDSSSLKSGWYWYRLSTTKQNILRKFKVAN